MINNDELFHKLSYYTLAHPNQHYFIHQHIVDAYTAQNAMEKMKPIKIIFALSGLFLYIEKGYTGRDVQNAHIRLSENKGKWPKIELPASKGEVGVSDVLHEEPGEKRDKKIRDWCESVWKAYHTHHGVIEENMKRNLSF